MAGQVQLTFFLTFILVVYGNVIPATFKDNSLSDLPTKLHNNNEVSPLVPVEGKLNKLFDTLLPSIRKFILLNGLEPMQLADYSDDLVKLLPGFLKGKIDFKNGWMQNFDHIKRGGDLIAWYQDKILRLDMTFEWDLMECQYQYYLKYLLYKRRGDAFSRFHGLNSRMIVTINLAKYLISFDYLNLSDARKFEFKLEGHFLDPLVNLVSKGITTIFKQRILADVERIALTVIQEKTDELNNKFPRPRQNTILAKD